MPHAHTTHELAACIEACLACSRECRQTALTHCLSLGGAHVEPDHFRLMFDCVTACDAAAALMAGGSPYHPAYCALCAEVCRACAASCDALADMDDCARACRDCAAQCDAMALHDMHPEPRRGGRGAERPRRTS